MFGTVDAGTKTAMVVTCVAMVGLVVAALRWITARNR